MALRRTVCGVENLTTAEACTPVWDTRSRRPSSSEQSTSSGFSSCSSPEGQIAAKPRSDSYFDHVQRRTMAETSVALSQSAHAPKIVAHAHGEHPVCSCLPPSRSKVKVYIRVKGESDETCLRQIYKPILDMIDTNTDVIDFIDDVTMDGGKWPLVLFGGCKDTNRRARSDALMTPSLAVVVLIQEKEIVGADRLEHATKYFRNPPWKFHHSEWVAAHRIRAYPYNSLDYFSVADELPICSVRQVHGSKEHLRLQRYVSHENWPDTLNLYKLIIDRDPDYNKSDFCVFTVETHRQYTVQFALKRLPKGVSVSLPCHTVLNFQVSDACALVPLLPHACRKLSDARWQTTDLDGNDLFLEVVSARRRHRQRPRSRTKSHGSRRSGSSTSSFASVLFDTAKEFIEAEESSSAASVFSEPYAYQRRNEFRLDESSSSSVAHSVLGVEASRGRNGPVGAQPPPSDDDVAPSAGTGHQMAPGSAGDITDIRATPDHRRFAWVGEMMDADWPIAGSAAAGCRRASTADVSQHGHSHQHTDSGFADDRSDDSERAQHLGYRQRHKAFVVSNDKDKAFVVSNDKDKAFGARSDKDNSPHGDPGDNTEDGLDMCDREIERLRLHQSTPDISGLSESAMSRGAPGGRPGSARHNATCRTVGEVLLPNRMSLAPPCSQNGHVTADLGGVENVRATPCTPRMLVSPGFGRTVPPRCTSTPLVHTPAFRSVPAREGGRTEVQERDQSSSSNRERGECSLSRQGRTACAKQLIPGYRERPASVHQFSSTHQDGRSCGSHPTIPERPQSAQIFADHRPRYSADSARPGGHHKPGLPPLPKPRRGDPDTLSLDKKRREHDDNNTSAFVAVPTRPSNGPKSYHGDVNSTRVTDSSRGLRVMAEIHRVDLSAKSGANLSDAEQSFEEAAIDCPSSLERRCTSPDVTSVSTDREAKFSGKQRPLTVASHNSSPPLESRNGAVTSLPRARSVSKMVTFAEDVQEKDISICMDDVSEASPRESWEIPRNDSGDEGGDPATMGFWI